MVEFVTNLRHASNIISSDDKILRAYEKFIMRLLMINELIPILTLGKCIFSIELMFKGLVMMSSEEGLKVQHFHDVSE